MQGGEIHGISQHCAIPDHVHSLHAKVVVLEHSNIRLVRSKSECMRKSIISRIRPGILGIYLRLVRRYDIFAWCEDTKLGIEGDCG